MRDDEKMVNAKILIVEDEAITANDIQDGLKGFGYDVPAIASSGEEAIKKAEELKPDLVLMDIVLKGDMDGIEAAEHIRNRFDIPVVYITAYIDEARLEKTRGTEPFGYIIKPFEDKELRPAIEMALQRHTLEKRLQESEEFSSNLMNKSPNPIIVINPDTSVRYVNPALERLTGFSSAELIGCMAPYPWWTEATLQKAHSALTKAMSEGTQKLDALFQKRTGERFWVEITSAPIRSDRELKYYLANWVDITERKQTEEALLQSEIKYRTLVEHIPAITYIAALDESSTTLYVSPQIETILGISPADYKADPDFWVKHLHPDDRERVIDEISRCHESDQPFISEYRMATKDGRLVWLSDDAVIVRDDKGNPLHLQGVMYDITERKQAEEKVKVAYRLRENFLMETSHRIITPATIIGGYVDLLLESSNLDESQKEKIRNIRERNVEVQRLVKDALEGKYLKEDGEG